MLPVFVVAEGCHVAILYLLILLSWKRSCRNNGKKGIKSFIRPLYLKTFRRPSPLWCAWHSWPRKTTIIPGGRMNGIKWRSGFPHTMPAMWLQRKTVTLPKRSTNCWNRYSIFLGYQRRCFGFSFCPAHSSISAIRFCLVSGRLASTSH